MATYRKVDYKGLWIVPVCWLISGLAILSESPYRRWVQSVLGVPQDGDTPMRYLVHDVATGISAGSGLVLILVLVAYTWRRSWYWSFAAVLSSMVLTPPIVYAVALVWRCLNLIDPTKATLLLNDRALERRTYDAGFYSALVFCIVVWVVRVVRWLRLRRSNGAGSEAAVGSKQ